ncbi:hypothetical protein JL857_20570 [Vibrio parahaemolyticus]|uniref:Uncharacterized protein n=2 Tax=Vibrio parahaemolyticus TaxID=670 RepID=A0A9Q3UG67_VIBPH|nr:hypothetical protein [Vibrio parahaemolyticus]MCC3807532.1 hypothetical protein [Vibrio parahaemolyticus]MCI9696500.1 hypothetical protein [Vibrio parahaemolyticus]MCI9711036.1 hypothetical protein [Vibrio parahaemolyticus]MCI9715916.1 hypothetical protein [Vibrio parahaemolyticus]
MSHLHIEYGFCEVQHKATLFEQLVQNTSILKVKTIGNIDDKAIFAALTYSLVRPKVKGVYWIQVCIPNKRKQASAANKSNGNALEDPGVSRRKFHHYESDKIKQFKKASRIYRKQRNRILTEKNWRQHINKKGALKEFSHMFTPEREPTFFLTRSPFPTPYSLCHRPNT